MHRHLLLLIWAASFSFLNSITSAPILTISGSNPILLSWSTNVPSFALQTKTNLGPGVSWEDWQMKPVIVGTNYVVTNTFNEPSRHFRLNNQPQLDCNRNLKQIGLAFRIWEMDNQDLFPFQVSTNTGGTRELRAIGPDGFDTNAFRHFQVMSNELWTPLILVCPGDILRNATTNFETLGPENVTYRLRTDDTVTDANPGEILAVCPIDGNTLYCDGSVTNGVRY